jgi:hypothetical protein
MSAITGQPDVRGFVRASGNHTVASSVRAHDVGIAWPKERGRSDVHAIRRYAVSKGGEQENYATPSILEGLATIAAALDAKRGKER